MRVDSPISRNIVRPRKKSTEIIRPGKGVEKVFDSVFTLLNFTVYILKSCRF